MITLLYSVALAAPGIEVGVRGGLHGVGTGDQPEVAAGFFLSPVLVGWASDRVGFEIDPGLAFGRTKLAEVEAERFLHVTPQVHLLADVLGEDSGGPLRPVLRAGVGADVRKAAGETEVGFLGSVGFGGVVRLAGALRLRADLDVLLPLHGGGSFRPGAQLTVGLSARFGFTRDRDGDGVPDRVDVCPDEPEDWDDFEEEDGCPEPDNDGDGIRDELDGCDAEPEDFDGVEDEDGCPEV